MSCQQQHLVSNLFADCDSHLRGSLQVKAVLKDRCTNHVLDIEVMPVALPPWLPGFVAIFGMHQLAASDVYTP